MEYYEILQTDISVQHLCKRDKRLKRVIEAVGDLKCTNHTDPYAFVIEEITGQMLSNKVSRVLCDRLEDICEGHITIDRIENLSTERIRSVGLSKAKAEYIKSFTKAVSDKRISFQELENLSDKEVEKRLTSIRGIGSWTAKMYLIFVMHREDILPLEDGAFLQGYKWLYNTDDVNKDSISIKCRKWKPYSSIAARYLYRAVDMGFTRHPFRQNSFLQEE